MLDDLGGFRSPIGGSTVLRYATMTLAHGGAPREPFDLLVGRGGGHLAAF